MFERFLIRGTRGSGPPPDLLFREISYSDGDGYLHVGRPDGTVRSFGAVDADEIQAPITSPIKIPLTPINGFLPIGNGDTNFLKVFGDGSAEVYFSVQSAMMPDPTIPVFIWDITYAADTIYLESIVSGSDLLRFYVEKNDSKLRFQKISGPASSVSGARGMLKFWKD